ncbi:hypothetical protein GCM10023194_30240 [Planotetraspora phitsanulokensis]|uniref:Uncharacterized protein n=1 Tax=Planotetraspora phitsanulokensis TaxID=575192 RepID=A0A8J3XGS5_9ACTN|nr:DUF6343 family protein [Planotetraspora phitsanulokensis]GII35838.1 hypothetical protein Pph01_08410 [Planotetraspora phitsanulokensis]
MMKPPHSSRSGTGDGRQESREGVRDKFWSVFSPTGERPQSALNLRIVLASFGLVVCGVLAAVAFAAGLTTLGVCLAVLALIAVVDLAVVIRRRVRRGDGHSLFG